MRLMKSSSAASMSRESISFQMSDCLSMMNCLAVCIARMNEGCDFVFDLNLLAHKAMRPMLPDLPRVASNIWNDACIRVSAVVSLHDRMHSSRREMHSSVSMEKHSVAAKEMM